MLTVTKKFSWAMSHRLDGHEGLCHNLHGHEYVLELTVKRSTDELILDEHSSKGMVIDFKDFKNAVNEHIVNVFDHAFVFNEKDNTSKEIAEFLQKFDMKVQGLPFRTTAENMVKWIYEELNEYFLECGLGIECVTATLYETPTSYATYTKDRK